MTTTSATPALPSLVAVATALPEHEAAQADARALVARMFQGTEAGSARLLKVFDHSGIERRSVCMPLEWYTASHTFEEQNALYVEHALRLGQAAAEKLAQRRVVEARAFLGIHRDAAGARFRGDFHDARGDALDDAGKAGGLEGGARDRLVVALEGDGGLGG